jgi:hypothetical protein
MTVGHDIDAVYCDVGGTLGDRDEATGKFIPYASSIGLLRTMREVISLQIGVITNYRGGMTNADVCTLLREGSTWGPDRWHEGCAQAVSIGSGFICLSGRFSGASPRRRGHLGQLGVKVRVP